MIKNTKIYALLKLLYHGYKQYKLQIIILTVLSFLGGLLEGIGINAAIPMFSFATGTPRKESDFITKTIEDTFSYFHITFNLKYLLVLICLLFIFRAVALILSNYIKIKITAIYIERTRNELLKKTLKADWPFLLQQQLGHLETILMTNVQAAGSLLQNLGSVVIVFSGLLMYIFVAVNISFNITVVTLALGVILLFAFKPAIYKIKQLAQATENYNRQTSHFVNENIVGMKTVKASYVSDKVTAIGQDYFSKLRQYYVKSSFLKIATDGLLQPIGLIFICGVFAFSFKSPNFNFAALAAVMYLIQRMFIYFQQLQAYMQNIGDTAPYLEKIVSYKNELVKSSEADLGNNDFLFNDEIRFDQVSFSYQYSKKVLSKVSFIIGQGQIVGLIGPSGSGKTTIVDLMLRLFTPTAGKILIDGQDIKDVRIRDWRLNIGYVSQDIFLKNDTITENIKFYDASISQQAMKEAAKMADIYDFIQTLPNGFNTVIGERGIMLSAGQRQRIIIARILARKPKLLILDEATSALDNESEAQIQKVINNLKGKLTIFVIAHRLSTVANCDKLLVLEKGEIIEQGSPSELLKDDQSYFYKVYNLKR